MFKNSLHKFKGELKDEARRIGHRFKEEFLDSDKKESEDDNKQYEN